MAMVMTAQRRFSPQEWEAAHRTKKKIAEIDRKKLEKLLAESYRLIGETREQSGKTQSDVNQKLEARLQDIDFFKTELEEHLDSICKEIDALEVYLTRIARMKENLAEPLHIANVCLSVRERRSGADLVHDDVQKNLLKEVEVYQGILSSLERCFEICKEQLRLNRKAKYHLEKDILHKDTAKAIDDKCLELKTHSSSTGFKDGFAVVSPNSVTQYDWQNFSEANCKKIRQQLQNSKQVRQLLDQLLGSIANDMKAQVDATNFALDNRIDEIKSVKQKLQAELDKVLDDIAKAEEGIKELEAAIKEKEGPLKLVQTRLNLRQQRPDIELCRDAPQYRMVSEVGELEKALSILQQRLDDMRRARQNLRRTAEDLKQDIEQKEHALHIDEVELKTMRASISAEPLLAM